MLMVEYYLHMHDNIELYRIATRHELQGTPCTASSMSFFPIGGGRRQQRLETL